MDVNNIYYQKYLQYKSKYIELKKSIGGGGKKDNVEVIMKEGAYMNV